VNGDLLGLMWVPFLMCLVLTGIHAYLGFHVIAREVVFVDIALAQISALGATAAFLLGFELGTWQSYVSGLGFAIVGALVLALTRSRDRHVSQEAVIGVGYAVSRLPPSSSPTDPPTARSTCAACWSAAF
jgi:zinc/manganese transport system permease protein